MGIPNTIRIAALAASVAVCTSAAAETMKGRIDAVDSGARTIQLNGITFQTTGNTQYDGGGFQTLKQGDRVRLEFERDGGRYVVVSVSKD